MLGVVVLLLAVGFVPFSTGSADFFAMARSEPTHLTIYSFEAVYSLVWWTLLGIGPIGLLLVVLAASGGERGNLYRSAAPPLGTRPAVLLVASIVTLGVVHWYIPHKEIRYLLPAAWPFCILVAIGLDALWEDGRAGRGVCSAAIVALAVFTFVIPRSGNSDLNGPIVPLLFDPQVPHFRGIVDPTELEPPRIRSGAA